MNVRTPDMEESETIVTIGSPDQELTSADVKRVMTTPLVKTLNLEGPWSKDLDLSPLAICKEVERMHIRSADNFLLSSFPTMNSLEDLGISNLSGDVTIDSCSSFPNLKTFGVYVSPGVKSINLRGIAQHDKLEVVNIKDTGIKALDLAPLSSLSQLIGLIVESSSIETIDIAPLKECESLRTISLRFNRDLREIDLSCLPTGIRNLSLTHSKFESLDLSRLKDLPELMHLNISNNDLREIDLSSLAHRLHLMSISLKANPVGTIDLAPLRSCPSLGTLDLFRMQLSDIDLSPLEGSKLDTLSLAHNPLEELDLTPLGDCENLGSISLLFCDRLEVVDITPILSLDCEVPHHPNTRLIADKRFKTDSWRNVEWY
jgi:Leucine-rich repeat (LRR) protein